MEIIYFLNSVILWKQVTANIQKNKQNSSLWKSNGLFLLIVMVIEFFCYMFVQNSYVHKSLFYMKIIGLDLTSEGDYYKLRRCFSTIVERTL